MTYNRRQIDARVRATRKSFITALAILTFLFVIDTVLLLLVREITVTFFCFVGIAAIAVLTVRTMKKYKPSVLYRKEIRGINVKEHEYVTTRRLWSAYGSRFAFSRVGTNKHTNQRTKNPTHAIVYLRLEDGNIAVIEGLTNAHTDEYEYGDELLCIEGTRYPIILGRKLKKQPCPICGTVNSSTESRCICCALEIEND